MLYTYLITAVMGFFVFVTMIILGVLNDPRANLRLRSRLSFQKRPGSYSKKELIKTFLKSIQAPKIFDRVLDERTILQSGLPVSEKYFKSLWWLLVLLGMCLGLMSLALGSWKFINFMIAVITVVFPLIGPYLYLQFWIHKRKREVTQRLPDFLDLLTLTVEAGLGFVPALRRVCKGDSSILGREFRQVLTQLDLGYTRTESLQELTWRLPSRDVKYFVEAIHLSEKLGTSLVRTLRLQASLLRTRRRQRAEVKVQTAPIRIIPALVFFFLPSLLLIYLAPPIINFLLRR